MIKVLDSVVENNAIKAKSLSFCNGIDLLKIKNAVAEMLEVIGKNKIFEEYTLHNISHIDAMLKIVEWLIPNETKAHMSAGEWLMLTLAVYFHDLGMVVSKNEFESRLENPLFIEYKQKNSQDNLNDAYLYQEFVRENHAYRIKSWIEGKNIDKYGQANEQVEILSQELNCLSEQFKTDLAIICESHHKDDIDDWEKYKIQKRYGNDGNAIVNLNYVAIILRIADLLHITNDRTPSISKKLLNISNPKSSFEWAKQEAVTAVSPKSERDQEGNIDDTLEKNTIEVHAYFSKAESAEAYFGLSDYLLYVESELIKCNKIAEKAKKQEASNHSFPWRKIDSSNIEAVGFEPKKLSFVLEQGNILQLLVGHTLYNDSSVVVRELTQNAIDAIKLQKCINDKKNLQYSGKVSIEWNSKTRVLSFIDNGTGMTIYDIENYLLRVGASKYREKKIKEEFQDFSPISRFGIGILTCFMIADDIEIETNPNNDDDINIICLRNVHGHYLLKKKNKNTAKDCIKSHGTIVNLHVREDVDMSSLEENLRKWIVSPGVEVILSIDSQKSIRIDQVSLKDIIVNYLEDEGIHVDNETIKVEEKTVNGVTLAYALKYNKYLCDWSFMTAPSNATTNVFPFGTCVEGIRVEFKTPGYKNEGVLSIANIKNSKHQTNVARTALEYDSNKDTLKSIYECYRMVIEDQIKSLESLNYSKSWALDESVYLMAPLLETSTFSDKVEPIDYDLLLKCLAEIPCIFVEKENKRTIISVNQMKELSKFDIVDCKIINAIETLLKETQNSTTVTEIVNIVSKDKTLFKSENEIISNYSKYNSLHKYGLVNKEVSEIVVDSANRKIKLTFSNHNGLWETYSLLGNKSTRIHIPCGKFDIEGLHNEIGVDTIGGIYLKSGTELCDYLQKSCSKFKAKRTKEGKILLQMFLESIFNSRFLESKVKEEDVDYIFKHFITQNRNTRFSSELSTKLWAEVDSAEFAKVILKENHSLFSIDNWTRKINKYDFD